MPEEISSQTDDDYFYPGDLAGLVQQRWADVPELPGGDDLLPDGRMLEEFLSGCYHASMLREEARQVSFRAIVAAPELFDPEGAPPESLLPVEFPRRLPFDPSELRRLSVATDPQRTLIGVAPGGDGKLQIWGLVHSGTRWLRHIQGGRRPGPSLPLAPVTYVHAPGRMEVYKDYTLVGKLQGGTLSGSRIDLFESQWLPEQFCRFREGIMQRHEAVRKQACGLHNESWAPIDPSLPRKISERMLKRVISVLRDAGHGGTIAFIPQENTELLSGEDACIDLRYRFAHGRPRLRFPDLIVEILNRLSRIYGTSKVGTSKQTRPDIIGWREFEATTDSEIATLDEGLFEIAHAIAGLAAADGAVVLNKRNELLGFGGMISGKLPVVRRVARALDIEGEQIAEEETSNVGARHRSAYRLAGALPGSVTVVISQDGGVRFVSQKDGRVTYWEQE